VVPETVPVPYVRPAMTTTTVPVTVPVQSSVPVTSYIPQVYTVPLGCGAAPAGGPNMGMSKGMPAANIGANTGADMSKQGYGKSALSMDPSEDSEA
ncbi:MAG TPA: hypothetical protein VGK13_06015, partial [Methanocellaceae archaeon]